MITVNALGDACPIPVVKTLNAIKELKKSDTIEVLVDNEIAVQNLTKMAQGKNFGVKSEKLGEKQYRVEIAAEVSVPSGNVENKEDSENKVSSSNKEYSESKGQSHIKEFSVTCNPDSRNQNVVVVISSSCMGSGDDKLGAALMKGFVYALSQQEQLPSTILFYNGGARLTCEDAPTLEDLKSMEAQGVEILTCGTCLDFYGLTDKLQVGSVTNMYAIAEKMTQAGLIVKP
ncbi:sulfurtransferase-like selenium metabolism protein YedF [Blautia schinkii]|nr:sulfurtransferase-like selenium metabolism protein YedF [Blautia schinkii]